MKQAMSCRVWEATRRRLAAARVRESMDLEISIAQAIRREFPKMTWGQSMSESYRILKARGEL
jgi:hypothetical protein